MTWPQGWPLLAGLLAGTACWMSWRPSATGVPTGRLGRAAQPPPARRVGRLHPSRAVRWLAAAARRVTVGRARSSDPAELAALTERLAALSRAGVQPQRAWQVLAAAGGAGSGPAAVVAAMLAGGGTVAGGLQVAAGQPGADRRLDWLATAYRVAETSGLPAAVLLDRFAGLVRAEVGREQDRSVALAGPRTTASLLSALPLAAPLLGWLLGADPVHALAGTGPGRLCLVTGLGFWLAGRAWAARLVERTREAGR